MVIRILDIAPGADTSEQGTAVLTRLHQAFAGDGTVTVSFSGINTATSSFVNAGFVPLLEHFALHDLKRRLRVIDSTRQINDMIRTCIEREASIAA